MPALYLHIPFCRRVCGYCDFFRSVDSSKMSQVVDGMMMELETEHDFLGDRTIDTIYFGGGTPSLLSAEQVRGFLLRIGDLYDISRVKEITLEANPDDLTTQYLEELRAAGINRLSIGIQSFDDTELKFMNRRHSSQQAIDAVRRAREAGFDNIAIDLIFGVSGFGAEVLQRSIDMALELDVEHIAAYHLTIEPNTLFGRRVERGELCEVSEDVTDAEYALLHERLTEAGYEHYEISNYAKVGRRSRHNSSYWRGMEYLGVGAGAHSFNGRVRRWAVDSIDRYLMGREERYESEVLTLDDRRNEMVMTSLRCVEGLDLTTFAEEFGEESLDNLQRGAQKWIEQGKLVECDGYIRILPQYFMVSDMIIESLFS
ncbi:MAG: radical SAM family heme chaperone HemW [Rikenellaceae bacterium]